MNKAVRIGIDQGSLLVWISNSCCLNHNDVTWDSSKENKWGYEGEKGKWDRKLERKIGGSRGTCSRKPLTLFWYNTYFNVVLDFFNETWDYAIIWIHFFNIIEKQRLLQWILYSFCVWIFYNVRLWWNEL
jgi:hypothetical protein